MAVTSAETSMVMRSKTRIMTLSAVFGALAIVLTQIFLPLFFGNPNLGTTPVSIAAVLCPLPVGAAIGLIKGIGASMWTSKPYIEFPAGIGHAMMAVFTYYLSKITKKLYAVLLGQFSRYIFTSGMISLYLGTVISFGLASGPEQTAYLGLLNMFQWFSQSVSSLPPWLGTFLIAWIGIFPTITLSILASAVVSGFVIQVGGKRFEELLNFGRP